MRLQLRRLEFEARSLMENNELNARDIAIASMKLKHVDFVSGCVNQDAREVNKKFSKTFNTLSVKICRVLVHL